MGDFRTVGHVLYKQKAIAAGGSDYSPWLSCRSAQGFNFIHKLEPNGGGGAPSLALDIEYFLLPVGWDDGSAVDFDPATSGNQVTVALNTGQTTLNTWVHTDTPNGLTFPVVVMRLKATVTTDPAKVSVIVAVNGL